MFSVIKAWGRCSQHQPSAASSKAGACRVDGLDAALSVHLREEYEILEMSDFQDNPRTLDEILEAEKEFFDAEGSRARIRGGTRDGCHTLTADYGSSPRRRSGSAVWRPPAAKPSTRATPPPPRSARSHVRP